MSRENIIPINYGNKNCLSDNLGLKSAVSQEMCKMEGEMDQFFDNLGQLDDDRKTNWVSEIKSPLVESIENRKSLKLHYNVRNFNPNEVKVKQRGNTLTVLAKHEELDPKRHVLREYTKSVILPEGIHGDDLYAETSKDGILTVSVPVQDNQLGYVEMIPVKDNRIKERKSSSKESVKVRKSSSSGSRVSCNSNEALVHKANKAGMKRKSSSSREGSVKSKECSPAAKYGPKGYTEYARRVGSGKSKECSPTAKCGPRRSTEYIRRVGESGKSKECSPTAECGHRGTTGYIRREGSDKCKECSPTAKRSPKRSTQYIRREGSDKCKECSPTAKRGPKRSTEYIRREGSVKSKECSPSAKFYPKETKEKSHRGGPVKSKECSPNTKYCPPGTIKCEECNECLPLVRKSAEHLEDAN